MSDEIKNENPPVQQTVTSTPPPTQTTTLDAATIDKLGRRRSFAWLKWLFGAVFLFVLGFGGWFWFMGRQAPVAPKVTLNIEGPDELPSNGQASVRVVVGNENGYAIRDLQLEVIYPSGLTYISSVPTAEGISGKNFSMNELPGGQKSPFILKLKSQGNVGDSKQLKASLRYKVAESNAVFASENSKEWLVAGSGVDLKISGVNEAGNGELVSFTIDYVNKSGAVMNNIKLTAQMPSSFKIAKTEPQGNLSEGSWSIPRLDPEQGGKVMIYGSFDGSQLGNQEVIRASLSVLDSSGSYAVQASSSFSTSIRNSPITSSVELQNSTKSVVNAGDRVAYTVKYQNNSTAPVRNVKVTIKVEGKGVNWADVRAEDAQVSTGSIVWSTATLGALSILSPGEKGTLAFELPVSNPPVRDSSEDLAITSSTSVVSDEYKTPMSGNSVEIKISTKPQVKAGLEYVSGANPPKVGQETVYKATLVLTNTSNVLKDTKVTARLPLGATSVSAAGLPSGVTLDSSASRLTWQVGDLAAYAGSFSPQRTVSFNIKMIPTAAQVGEEVFVLNDITLNGTDSFTTRPLTVKAVDLSSDDGATGSGRGRVVK